MRYVLRFFADEDTWLALLNDDRATAIAGMGDWYAKQARAGRIVAGCRLRGWEEAVTVRLGPAGRSATPAIRLRSI
jgi:hypothetical protein